MIKMFNEFIKENKSDEKILVIVDVQKDFEKFIPQGYVEALIEYCKKFDSVYQIWDSNKANKPSYVFPNQKGVVVKKFGTKFSKELDEIITKLNHQYPYAKEGEIFKFDDTKSYVIKVNNHHGWFYVPEEMANLFKSLKGKDVVLVGGAYGECLKDVYEAMEAFGVRPRYDKRFIYSAKTRNNQIFDPKIQPTLI